jgi:hypothetical protein
MAGVCYALAAFGGRPDRVSMARSRRRTGSRSPCFANMMIVLASVSAPGPVWPIKSRSQSAARSAPPPATHGAIVAFLAGLASKLAVISHRTSR